MKSASVLLFMAVGLVAMPETLLPQAVGDRVRVTTSGGRLIGQIAGVSNDRLDVALDGFELAALEGPFHTVSRTDILRLERSRGTRSFWKLFAVLGGLFGAGLANICIGGCPTEINPYTPLFAAGGALAGAGLGLAVGALLRVGERWELMPPDGTEPAFSPILDLRGSGGHPAVGVGLRLRL
ncbi:hypothetical protein [Candidatus Palauibacter sp.]|uniref:hypothetical protein n=1 Tax=Candidatus Palauibacter sp. TaxID=3101350 RepID=UPI003B5C2E3B